MEKNASPISSKSMRRSTRKIEVKKTMARRSMSRASFLRGAGAAILGAGAALVGRATTVRAAGSVVGTGNPAVDVPAVQAAVNGGGTVYLLGTFDFGTDNFVNLTTDVEIIGEEPTESGERDPVTKNKERQWHTVINNGGTNNECLFNCENSQVKFAIRNIHCDGPKLGGVRASLATRVEITACKVTNVVEAIADWFPAPLNSYRAFSIGGGSGVMESVIIRDNVCSPNGNASNFGVGVGIGLPSLTADIQVSGNLVEHYSHLGIMNMNGGTTTISNNRIHTGNSDGIGWGVGIAGDWYPRDPSIPLGSVFVTNNELNCTKLDTEGIVCYSPRKNPILPDSSIVINHNNIYVETSFGGITAYGDCRNMVCTQNKIEGTMGAAILLDNSWLPPDRIIQSCTFQGNNISNAQTNWTDVLFDVGANNNVLIGNSGNVADLGAGNIITGFTRISLGPEMAQQLKESLQAKHDALQGE